VIELRFVDHVRNLNAFSVAEASSKDFNRFIYLVSFLMSLWSTDRQMNAEQSSGGVFNDVVEIFGLQNFN
jgi:hypothetical protein